MGTGATAKKIEAKGGIFSDLAQYILERQNYLLWKEGRSETPEEMLVRVSGVVASLDQKYRSEEEVKALERAFFQMMRSLDFLPILLFLQYQPQP
ncbi:ribonucleotide reductase N-terminal alpha domain-containing protein [Bdellovibrionota bacterium]